MAESGSLGQTDEAGIEPVDLGRLSPLVLSGVGPSRAERLAGLGVSSVRDLLTLRPRRLDVAPAALPIAALRGLVVDGPVCDETSSPMAAGRPGAAGAKEVHRIEGEVTAMRMFRMGGRRSTLRIGVSDGTASIDALFFNQPWLRELFAKGDTVELMGSLVNTKSGPALVTPRVGRPDKPLPAPGALEPIYPLVDGVGQEYLRGLILDALDKYAHSLKETLTEVQLGALGFPALPEAVASLHRPTSEAAYGAALSRLAFEGLLGLAARLEKKRQTRLAGAALRAHLPKFQGHPVEAAAALEQLFPFPFTGAQKRVIAELLDDMESTTPMGRLLQGDVGAGKTAVALAVSIAMVKSGGQVAFMAPTEVLAEQHFGGNRELLRGQGIDSCLLTGSVSVRVRRELLAGVATGRPMIVFGTHALFSKDVVFGALGLCVIDEQHRFGVGQRERLTKGGAKSKDAGVEVGASAFPAIADAHVLHMTATPIPRSLALILHGDLDLAILDEKPPGRGAIRTRWVRGAERRRIRGLLAERLAAGERAFWVLPRIDSTEAERGGRGVVEVHEWLLATDLAEHGIELVHGRLKSDERRRRFQRFKSGESKLLVGTTVIEVGVDVPEATVMVIEDAERLGLAQLHQLRGRIGRGPGGDPWCLLLGPKSGEERFRLLESTNDGFVIAEADLEKRGMGDLAGVRQSGENLEGLAELDTRMFDQATRLIRSDPTLLEDLLAKPE
jgi:ATP-dependent DNA helicase RecG